MDEKKIIKNFISGELPVEIPSADAAWNNMKQKLEKNDKGKPVIGWRSILPLLIILTLSITSWLIFNSNNHENNINTSKKSSTAKVNIPLPTTQYNTDDINKERVKNHTDTAQKVNDAVNVLINDNKTPHAKGISRYYKFKKYRSKNKTVVKVNNGMSSDTLLFFDKDVENKNQVHRETDSSLHKDSASTVKSKLNKQDSGSVAEDKKDIDNNFIQAGLQWNFQLPLNGSREYFVGPNGSLQPYYLLLPGVWISLGADKYQFTAEVNPFATSVLSNKPYSKQNINNSGNVILETRTLKKIFGVTSRLGFEYNVKNKWWFGANMQGNFWSAGAAKVKGERVNAGSNNTVLYENNYSFNDSAWIDFQKFQVGAGIQLLYKQRKWQAGIRFDYFLTPLTDKPGQKNNNVTEVFIRWSIIKK